MSLRYRTLLLLLSCLLCLPVLAQSHRDPILITETPEGQEMQQPRGLTIEVTTYTDGTRKAVKVLK